MNKVNQKNPSAITFLQLFIRHKEMFRHELLCYLEFEEIIKIYCLCKPIHMIIDSNRYPVAKQIKMEDAPQGS